MTTIVLVLGWTIIMYVLIFMDDFLIFSLLSGSLMTYYTMTQAGVIIRERMIDPDMTSQDAEWGNFLVWPFCRDAKRGRIWGLRSVSFRALRSLVYGQKGVSYSNELESGPVEKKMEAGTWVIWILWFTGLFIFGCK